ncbi:MAG: two-component system LytT family sensor kinase [Paraglaciecola sp.]|jgi:two-component system LytT family sensor kinase
MAKLKEEEKQLAATSIKKVLIMSSIGGAVFMLVFPTWTSLDTWGAVVKNYLTQVLYWIVLWKTNEFTVRFLNRKISWLEKPVLRFVVSTVATILATITALTLLNLMLFWYYLDVMPSEYLRDIEALDFIVTMLITAAISMFIHGRAFLMGWRDSSLEVERLKQANIAAQYETLKNQVNPHFLFNSLNVLSSLVYKDQDLAAKFIKQLSKVYRYVLDTRDKEVVSLQREIDALESYIFLMKIRFGKNLQVTLNVQPQSNEQMVPLTLQMLLENAIKHNEVSKAFPLKIDITRLDNGLISMKNNLKEKRQLAEKSGVGLANIEARFKYISDKKVQILKTAETFDVHVPIVEMDA